MNKKIYLLGIDIGATHTSLGIVSRLGKIYFPQMVERRQGDKSLVERLLSAAAQILDQAGKAGKEPVGIGIGSPGIVDSRQGIVTAAGNLPELFGARLSETFHEKFGLPVVVENDVNALSLAEMLFGVARGQKNFMVFALGTDLGGGIVIDGRLHRGANFIAAEFGHLTLDLEGKRCVCGGYGCSREYVSGQGLTERGREELPGDSLALKMVNGEREKLGAREIFSAWRKGDLYAEKLVEEFGRHFGALVSNVMKVLDPELVVLAGEVCRQEPEIISLVVRWVRHYYFPLPRLPEFRLSKFSKEEAVLGPAAVFLVEKRVLSRK